MRTTPQIAAAIALMIAILACTLPSGDAVSGAATAFAQTQTAQAGIPSPTPSIAPAPADASATPVPTATVAPLPTACSPIVTASVDANVRAGDSTLYEIIGFLGTGASAPVMGRNAADTWWYIQYGGGHGWIAKSVTNASCLPSVVAVVAPPPLPPTPTSVPAAFAVTGVSYAFSEVDLPSGANCPMMTANITVNAPGTVTYKWTRSDGASASMQSINFASAGTQAVTTTWSLGSVWEGDTFWLGIYVEDPNHQDFGHRSFTDACDG